MAIPYRRSSIYLTIVKGGPVIATGSNTTPTSPFDADHVESHVTPSRPFFCFGAQAVSVEVDRVTGEGDCAEGRGGSQCAAKPYSLRALKDRSRAVWPWVWDMP